MSIEAITWVMKTHIPDGVAKLVAMVLADYADPATGKCWPKIPTLAKQCSQSERTVQRKLRLLEDLDLLHAEPSWDRAGKQEANRYVLHLPGVPRPPRGDRIVVPPRDPTPMGDTVTPIQTVDGCRADTGMGDNAVTHRGDTAVTPIETPPSESLKEESPQPPVAGGRPKGSKLFRGNPGAEPVRLESGPVERNRAALDAATRDRFERLWAAYPVEGLGYADRPAAERLYAGLSEADQALAVTAASGYRAQLARRDAAKPIYAKALQNWLRQRRFTNLRPKAPAEPAPVRVFVREGSPGWTAWMAHERALGRPTRTPTWSQAERAEGWWFPSDFPPADAVAA